MKITAEVLSVSTNGDTLSVQYQGKAGSSARWMEMLRGTITVPENAKTRRSYYVGRSLTITVEPSK